MSIKIKKGRSGSELVEYRYEVGGGKLYKGSMPLSVAAEIASRCDVVEVDGSSLRADKYLFPAECFDVTVERTSAGRARKKS